MPLVGLRNELAHPEEQFLSDDVRTKGEASLRWLAKRLGVRLEIVEGMSLRSGGGAALRG